MSIKEDITKITENLKYIINAPIVNIMAISGVLLVVLSFCNFNLISGRFSFSLMSSPRWIMLIIGVVLLLGCFVWLVFAGEHRRINKKARIEDGLSLTLGRIATNVKIGKIQEVPGLNQSAVVALPANTSFIDDCITDKNSALGAFFLERYPGKTLEITQVIEDQLKNSGYQPTEDGTYAPGTTILLPSPYDTPARILITASTIRKEDTGIRAEPSTICECVKQIFMITSAKKISELRMPVLGSGHGGLDINAALIFLLLAIRHYSNYYHHVKSIDIIISENDAKRLKDTYRLQYLMLLTEASK